MPKASRSAEAGSVSAIEEDLRLVRQAGGLVRAGVTQLKATLAMMFPAQVIGSTELPYVRATLEMHINRGCHNYAARQPDDSVAQATAVSLRTLLLRPEGQGDKVAAIRRAALSEHGCRLTTDGLRKREDLLIAAIARTAFQELKAIVAGAGPQTIEELVYLMRPIASELREHLHEGLQLIYRFNTTPEENLRHGILVTALWLTTRLQGWSRSMILIRRRPISHTPAELLFAEFAMRVLFLGFNDGEDKDLVYEVMKRPDIAEEDDLWEALQALPGGDDLLVRWDHWMMSCHQMCTYHRSFAAGGTCQPHTLTVLLEAFEDFAQSLEAGTLNDEIAEELGAWGVKVEE